MDVAPRRSDEEIAAARIGPPDFLDGPVNWSSTTTPGRRSTCAKRSASELRWVTVQS